MTRRIQLASWLIVAFVVLLAGGAGAGNFGMPGHDEMLSGRLPDTHDPDDFVVEAAELPGFGVTPRQPDALVVKSESPDDRVAESKGPDDLSAESEDPDDLVVEAGDPDPTSGDAQESVVLPTPDRDYALGSTRELHQSLEDARARYDAIDAKYTSMITRNYPRGEARRVIVAERDVARRDLADAERRYPSVQGEPVPASN